MLGATPAGLRATSATPSAGPPPQPSAQSREGGPLRRRYGGPFARRLTVKTTKPKSSLRHYLKSVPWALTADTNDLTPPAFRSRNLPKPPSSCPMNASAAHRLHGPPPIYCPSLWITDHQAPSTSSDNHGLSGTRRVPSLARRLHSFRNPARAGDTRGERRQTGCAYIDRPRTRRSRNC